MAPKTINNPRPPPRNFGLKSILGMRGPSPSPPLPPPPPFLPSMPDNFRLKSRHSSSRSGGPSLGRRGPLPLDLSPSLPPRLPHCGSLSDMNIPRVGIMDVGVSGYVVVLCFLFGLGQRLLTG